MKRNVPYVALKIESSCSCRCRYFSSFAMKGKIEEYEREWISQYKEWHSVKVGTAEGGERNLTYSEMMIYDFVRRSERLLSYREISRKLQISSFVARRALETLKRAGFAK